MSLSYASVLSSKVTTSVSLTDVCSTGSLERGRSIFGANYDRLIELKRKWDPKNVFSKSHILAPQLNAWHGGAHTTATV